MNTPLTKEEMAIQGLQSLRELAQDDDGLRERLAEHEEELSTLSVEQQFARLNQVFSSYAFEQGNKMREELGLRPHIRHHYSNSLLKDAPERFGGTPSPSEETQEAVREAFVIVLELLREWNSASSQETVVHYASQLVALAQDYKRQRIADSAWPLARQMRGPLRDFYADWSNRWPNNPKEPGLAPGKKLPRTTAAASTSPQAIERTAAIETQRQELLELVEKFGFQSENLNVQKVVADSVACRAYIRKGGPGRVAWEVASQFAGIGRDLNKGGSTYEHYEGKKNHSELARSEFQPQFTQEGPSVVGPADVLTCLDVARLARSTYLMHLVDREAGALQLAAAGKEDDDDEADFRARARRNLGLTEEFLNPDLLGPTCVEEYQILFREGCRHPVPWQLAAQTRPFHFPAAPQRAPADASSNQSPGEGPRDPDVAESGRGTRKSSRENE